jgi:hypothetical protein
MPNVSNISKMSVEELEERFGVKAKSGEITSSGGKYVFSAGGKKYEIDPQYVLSSKPISDLNKKTAAGGIIIEGRLIVIIIDDRIFKRVPILCYIPAPDFRRRISDIMQAQLVNELIKDKRLPVSLGKQILKEIRG